MAKSCFSTVLLAVISMMVPAKGEENKALRIKDDQYTLSAEYTGLREKNDTNGAAEGTGLNVWVYAALPSFKIGKVKIFSALEADLLDRKIALDGAAESLNRRPLQRYGLFGGATIFPGARHRGVLLLGCGAAGDFSYLSKRMGYVHAIYEHRFFITDKLHLGLGIAVYFYNPDKMIVPFNLLPYLQWIIAPQTILSVCWDNAELQHRFTKRVTGVVEVRYDMSFYRLSQPYAYRFVSVGAGGGGDILLGKSWYLRVRVKANLFEEESVNDGTEKRDFSSSGVPKGFSVKCAMVKAN